MDDRYRTAQGNGLVGPCPRWLVGSLAGLFLWLGGVASAAPGEAPDPLVVPAMGMGEERTGQGDVDLFSKSFDELLLLEVVTTSAKSLASGLAPSTVYVVTEEVILRRGYGNLTDLLEDIPEIEVQRKAIAEFREMVTVRGLAGNNRFIILLDGYRVNDSGGSPHSMGFNYPLVNVERVEVVLGPASALYGADAFTGVINIITKGGKEIDGVKAVGSYGRFNTTHGSLVAGREIFDDVSLAFTGSVYYSDEPYLPDFYPDEFAWYTDMYKANGKAQAGPWAPDQTVDVPVRPWGPPTLAYFAGVRLDAGDFQLGYTRLFDSYTSSGGVKPEFSLYVDEARWAYTIQSTYAQHTLRAMDDRLRLLSSVSVSTYEVDPDSRFANSYAEYGGYNAATKEWSGGYKYQEDVSWLLEERLSYDFARWLSASLGLTLQDVMGQPKSADLYHPFDPDVPANLQGHVYPGTRVEDAAGNDLSVPTDFYYYRYQNLGTYLELQSSPWDWLSVTAGGRMDYNTRWGTNLAPRAGIAVSPWQGMWFKTLYGEAFLAPSPYYAFNHFGSFFPATDADGNITGLQSGFWRVPNPDLKPEKLRTLEVSASQNIDDMVIISANGYYTWLRDYITNQGSPDGEFQGWPVGWVERLVNEGEASAYGATGRLEGMWRPGGFTINPWVSYTWSDGEVAGEPLPFNATHTIKGGLDLAWRGISMSTRVLHRSESLHPTQNVEGKALSVPGSTVLNLHLRYSELLRFDRFRLSAWLQMRNLLDARYEHVTNEGDQFTGAPQDPLRVMGGLELQY
jgi:outer membrane receptor protein involved in Fe transport